MQVEEFTSEQIEKIRAIAIDMRRATGFGAHTIADTIAITLHAAADEISPEAHQEARRIVLETLLHPKTSNL